MTLAATVFTSRKLDVGCGVRKLPGFAGIDMLPESAADVFHDLEKFPWPFTDDAFDHVVCRHSLGHLNDIVAAMEELHRITAPGGIIEIVSPHFSSDNQFTDITHRHSFGVRSMDYFCINGRLRYRYSQKAKFRLQEARISMLQAHLFPGETGRANPFRWVGIEWFINRFARLYEHFLAFIVRANEVYFRLEVIKP
jgi:SAM-dependent methyltransferase